MPTRKQPKTLETQSLEATGDLVLQTCEAVSTHCSSVYAHAKMCASLPEVDQAVVATQDMIFEGTAHYFHADITKQILRAMSGLVSRGDIEGGRRGTGRRVGISAVPVNKRRRLWLKEQIQLSFVSVLCHPAVKTIELEPHLHWAVVSRLCSLLPDLPGLHSLHMEAWSCRKYSLMAQANQQEGFILMFLPGLVSVAVADVSHKFLASLAMYCPNIVTLKVSRSEVTDEVATYIAKCQKLQSIEFYDTNNISPFGYAELLRSLPELRCLGRCDCFGEVMTTLYHKWSLYHRSVGSIPSTLALEEVNCSGPMADHELEQVRRHCPNMKRLRFLYNATYGQEDGDTDLPHLSVLTKLRSLSHLSLVSADFYSHSLFKVIGDIGCQLSQLDLSNIDELNLNSLLMVGRSCQQLKSLSISCCHYTPEGNDTKKLVEICSPRELTRERRPFQCLVSATFILTTSTHIPLLKYVLYFARELVSLKLSQLYQAMEDSFMASLLEWNPMLRLEDFEMTNGPHLTIIAANILIQACPCLKRLGRLSNWGGVEKQQVAAVTREIRARNLDIVLDPQDNVVDDLYS